MSGVTTSTAMVGHSGTSVTELVYRRQLGWWAAGPEMGQGQEASSC